MVEHVEFGC